MKSPSLSGLANPAADLLRTLDRELTAADLDVLPAAQLRQLEQLLHHWQGICSLRIERRVDHVSA